MTIKEIRVPEMGESLTQAQVGAWFKKTGETVSADEPLVELETDKVTIEVPAPSSGVLGKVDAVSGEVVEVGALLCVLDDDPGQSNLAGPVPLKKSSGLTHDAVVRSESSGEESYTTKIREALEESPSLTTATVPLPPSPSARKLLEEAGLEASQVQGTGKRSQILKHDVSKALLEKGESQEESKSSAPSPALGKDQDSLSEWSKVNETKGARIPASPDESEREKRVKMTALRKTIAGRLKYAQNTAAILTTFNDIDMSAVIRLRKLYKEEFENRHGIKLGFMGFFVKACTRVLQEIPAINAEIDGDELVYKNYYHIGIAVGTDKGLVVPVVRDADAMSLSDIERQIADYGSRARAGRLSIEEIQGGTFTITNGGVFGSLLSTPILNTPQSGILGLHRIDQRAVVVDQQIVARPIMYVSLSYDHRIVDGREAVTFLARIKDCIQSPDRFLLGL